MADTSAEKLQNMNIQDFDGSEFDPFSPQSKMANMNNGDQPVDLLGECFENGQMTNGSDKHVSFDQEAGIGLPDPSYINQGQGQGQKSGFGGQNDEGMQRHMSEGEILGYQNEYGESIMTGQVEYTGDSEEDSNNLIDIQVSYPEGQAHTVGGGVGEYSSPDPSQNVYDQYVENDYVDDNDEGVQDEEEQIKGPVEYDDDEIDPNNWHPDMDADRLRRSKSPERSVSPFVKSESGGDVDSDMISSPSEMSHPEPVSEPVGAAYDRESSIPKSEGVETPDLISQGSQQLSSEETESLDSRSETEGTPRRRRIPKPKTRKAFELPPWDDNVVIPKLPRMKPTLIGKQADLPPPSPPRLHRPRTAPARHNAKDASSDSGVEEEAKSPRKSSGDVKKKYGTDTKNERYKPGGGNIQVFSQKVDTRSVTPRTDTTKPRSALSPRISPSKEKAPLTPKAPAPNTKHVQSKIGSLNNVKHSPGGGNVKVLNAKVDFSNVHSKVGSKDKIDYKPKGGDKKIESQKLSWQTESKVGSLKNVTYSPGGGNLKHGTVEGTMDTRENIHYQPGGGNIPEPYEEELDWDADAKVNTLDNLGYEPGGGCVKIFSEKLNWKAEPKVDTGLQRRSESIPIKSESQKYDSSKQQVAITIEPVPDRFNHTYLDYLEPVPEVEYQSAADVKNNLSQIEKPAKALATDSRPIRDTDTDQTDGSHFVNGKNTESLDQDWKQGPPPPPKPPRCIHKEWEREKPGTSEDLVKPDEREILTFTKEELDEILRKRDLVESQEKGFIGSEKEDSEESVLSESDIEKSVEQKNENINKEISSKWGEDIPISDITNNEGLTIRSVDHKEDTIILERMRIEKINGKENEDDISKTVTPKKKSGFVNKMKGLFSTSKSKQRTEKGKDNRFSRTSYGINRSNSNSSRISVKGKKLKDFANEEEKEVELMVKYLGYHSPKLTRKVVAEPANDDRGKESKKENKKQILKQKQLGKCEPVQKLANLGYPSPKLLKKGGKPLVMTGSPRQKRKVGLESKGVCEIAKCFVDEKDRVDLMERENATRIHVKEGVTSDYQDIDFGVNVSDVKNGKSLETFIAFNDETDFGMLQGIECERPLQGIVNEGYEYDDVASDEDTECLDADDSDESFEDERHVSVAELKVNSTMDSKKLIQTTTFRYKMDKRPTSPLNVIKQEMVEALDHSFPSVEDRTNVERELDATLVMKEDFAKITSHDRYGYAQVHKNEKGDTELSEVVMKSGGSLLNENYQKKCEEGLKEQKRFLEIYESSGNNKSLQMHRDRYEKKSRSDQEDVEHELTLEEELKTVLANIQDNDGSYLKSPRRHEGTETGSRPGTPKITVKPLRMKAVEEGKGVGLFGRYGMRRYLSDENLSRPSQRIFSRSNRTQSMIVRKHGTLETGSGAIKAHSGNASVALHSGVGSNLARSSKMINLSGTQHVTSVPPADDLRQDSLTSATEYKTDTLSANLRNEGIGSFTSVMKSGVVKNNTAKSSENTGSLAAKSFNKGSDNLTSTGVSKDKDMRNFNSSSVNKNLSGDCSKRHSGNFSTEEMTNMVINQRLSWSAKSRVGSLENSSHSPGGGNVKILDQKIEIKAQSKIGSTANLKHKPGGGDKKIETQKLEFKDTARSKVGSMDKVKHKPGGGDIKIHNEKLKWETSSRVKSLDNAEHVAGGGDVKIIDEKPVWMAASKVESLVNADYVPGGGQVKILDEKVDFTNTAKSKVGSMDKVKHQPGGGDKKIETQKLNFKETAKARTDTGASTGERPSSHDHVRSDSVTSSQDGSVQE